MHSIGNAPQLSAAYVASADWLEKNAADVVRNHPNQWVAIHGHSVIAADANLDVVAQKAAHLAPEEDTVIFYADDGSRVFRADGAGLGSPS